MALQYIKVYAVGSCYNAAFGSMTANRVISGARYIQCVAVFVTKGELGINGHVATQMRKRRQY